MKNCNCDKQKIDMAVCGPSGTVLPSETRYITKVIRPSVIKCGNIMLEPWMMSVERTKYVIKWDFDLDGKTITVPENCVLEFDGGSLRNGTIIGQDTFVNNVGGVETIFGTGITQEGTWRYSSSSSDPKEGISREAADELYQPKGSYQPAGNYPTTPEVEQMIGEIESGKDKDYNPAEFSGLGRVYLKKNIVEVGGVEKNVLTQSAFYKEGTQTPNTDTVFVVQYDFDLNGQTINIPARCILEFDGGSISNGTIVGNRTDFVTAEETKIFGDNLTFEGTFIRNLIHIEWWGAKGDRNVDCAPAFTKANAYASCIVENPNIQTKKGMVGFNYTVGAIELLGGVYKFNSPAVINSNISLHGNHSVIEGNHSGDYVLRIESDPSNLFYWRGWISNLIIDGNENKTGGIYAHHYRAMFTDIRIKDCVGTGFKAANGSFGGFFRDMYFSIYGQHIYDGIDDLSDIIAFDIPNSHDGKVDNFYIEQYPTAIRINGNSWRLCNIHFWGSEKVGIVGSVGIILNGSSNLIQNYYNDTVVKQDKNKGYTEIVNGILNGGIGIFINGGINRILNVWNYVNPGVFYDEETIAHDNVVVYFENGANGNTFTNLMNTSGYHKVPSVAYAEDYNHVGENNKFMNFKLSGTDFDDNSAIISTVYTDNVKKMRVLTPFSDEDISTYGMDHIYETHQIGNYEVYRVHRGYVQVGTDEHDEPINEVHEYMIFGRYYDDNHGYNMLDFNSKRHRVFTISTINHTYPKFDDSYYSDIAPEELIQYAIGLKKVNGPEHSIVYTDVDDNGNVLYRRPDGRLAALDWGKPANRPANLERYDVGFQYFDTSLKRPVWWDGSEWIDNQEYNNIKSDIFDSMRATFGTFKGGYTISESESSEWKKVLLDNDNCIIAGLRIDGSIYIADLVYQEVQE